MKSFYKTKDKMREDFLQNEQDVMMKETFKDSRKIPLNISNNTKKVLLVIIVIVFAIIATGGINLSNKHFYDMEFDISITGVDVQSIVHSEYKKAYIPFVLYSTADEFGIYNYKTIEKGQSHNILRGMGVYLLKVTAYRCHYINDEVNIDAACSSESPDSSLVDDPRLLTKVKSNKVKYNGLRIIDRGNNNEIIYDGDYIQDLSKYIYKPSTYAIFVFAEYGSAKATVSTTVVIEEE